MLCFFPHPPLPMDRFFRFVQPIASSKRITNPKLSRSSLSRFIWNICLFHNDLMHPLCIRASDHSVLLRRVLFHSSPLRLRTTSMVKPWKFCHPGKQFIHIGIGRCHFRPRSRSLGDTTSMFFLVLLFLLGGNFGHILFYLVAFIQWNDLRGQTIPAFLMKGCFVDSIDIDGFNWIRITDQIK